MSSPTDLPAPLYPTVRGFCPGGCGETLFLDHDGAVTCSARECEHVTAVDEILANREAEHVVEITDVSYTLVHPLRERIDGALMTCPLQQEMKARRTPPMAPGLYRVTPAIDSPSLPAAFDWQPISTRTYRVSLGQLRGGTR